MLETSYSRIAAFLGVSLLLGAKIGSAQQTCQASINGFYSYSAIGNGLPGALLPTSTGTTGTGSGTITGTGSTTGTTTTAPPFSNTGVGQLVGGATNTAPFASSGTLYFDNGGNIRASSTSQFGTANTTVGTYVVNSDCTITVTLNDAFGTNKTAATLQGVILGNGSEIDLGVLQNVSTTTSTTGTGTGTGTGNVHL